MKNVIVIFLSMFFLFFNTAKSQNENVIKTKIPVEAVVLYLSGAEISHVKEVSCVAGRNLLIVQDVTAKIDPQSLRISLGGGASVLSVTTKSEKVNDGLNNFLLDRLKDSIASYELLNQKCNDEIDALETEKKMLLLNMSIGGQTNGLTIAELEKASNFYRTRIGEINKKYSELKNVVNKQTQIIMELKSELIIRTDKVIKDRALIYILLNTPTQQAVQVDIKYLVKEAGWSPTYDIIAEDIEKPIKLIYRARFFNGTKIDWTKIKLKLSTADPFTSAIQPALSPWYLSFQYGSRINALNQGNYNQALSGLNKKVKQEGSLIYEEINVIDFNAEFELKGVFDVPSDGKAYMADVLENTLDATYQYTAIPKLDKDAFLLSKVTGWEDLNLVEGPVNIYNNSAFIGQSYLSINNVGDTLEISLGRDKNIMVTRSKVKNFSSTTLMGNKKKETFSYELNVRNNKKTTCSIVLYDQVPVSQNSEIEVDVIEISKANLEIATGKIWWDFQLKSGETKKVIITYAIRYPKTSSVNIKQMAPRAKLAF